MCVCVCVRYSFGLSLGNAIHFGVNCSFHAAAFNLQATMANFLNMYHQEKRTILSESFIHYIHPLKGGADVTHNCKVSRLGHELSFTCLHYTHN